MTTIAHILRGRQMEEDEATHEEEEGVSLAVNLIFYDHRIVMSAS